MSLEATVSFLLSSMSVVARAVMARPRHRTRATAPGVVAALVLASALSGCGAFDHKGGAAQSPPPAPTRSTTSPTSTTLAPPPETEPPQVLDPGQEPRRPVRVTLRKGQVS